MFFQKKLTMPKLYPDEFEIAAPLFENVQYYAPVPYSVIEGNEPGTIFVDRHQKPTVALVCSHGGYYYLAGCPDNTQFCGSLGRLLFDEMGGMDSFHLFFFPSHWEEKLNTILPARATQRTIRAFDFNPTRFSHANWRDQIPTGFYLKSIDEISRQKIAIQVNPSISHTQGWIDDNLTLKDLGFYLLHKDEVVSICCCSFFGNRLCDIAVATAETFRKRSFATLVASAFIDRCSAKGITPVWHCSPENLASNALARKLGFEEKGDFQAFHCWVKPASN